MEKKTDIFSLLVSFYFCLTEYRPWTSSVLVMSQCWYYLGFGWCGLYCTKTSWKCYNELISAGKVQYVLSICRSHVWGWASRPCRCWATVSTGSLSWEAVTIPLGIIWFSTAAFMVGSGVQVKGPPPTLPSTLSDFWVSCWDGNFLLHFSRSVEKGLPKMKKSGFVLHYNNFKFDWPRSPQKWTFYKLKVLECWAPLSK